MTETILKRRIIDFVCVQENKMDKSNSDVYFNYEINNVFTNYKALKNKIINYIQLNIACLCNAPFF